MTYQYNGAPGFLDLDGLRRYVEEQLQRIARAEAEMEAELTADEAAWTAYPPVVSATSGAFTTVSAVGRYKQIGKTVFLTGKVTITTVGTATGSVFATLPVNAVTSVRAMGTGRENGGATSKVLIVLSNATTAQVSNADNTSPCVSGSVLDFSLVYETP